MKCVRGIWLPDHETMVVRFLKSDPSFAGAGTYQLRKLIAAYASVADFGHAVDVGAHVGTWSRVMARCFVKLTAFEPIADVADCFERNLAGSTGCDVTLHRVALGQKDGLARMEDAKKTMLNRVCPTGATEVPMRTLDGFALGRIDFLKVDVEGFEKFVLLGGEKTIRASRPVVVIEQKPNQSERYNVKQKSARGLLKKWGALEKWTIDGDTCMAWQRA